MQERTLQRSHKVKFPEYDKQLTSKSILQKTLAVNVQNVQNAVSSSNYCQVINQTHTDITQWLLDEALEENGQL